MTVPTHCDSGSPARRQYFATTHWTVVLSAKQEDSARSFDALSQLCRTYWYPLYAYVRRRGYTIQEAQDLTQEFFARLIEKNPLGSVDRARGKFRSFLLGAMNHFLANEWRRVNAQKRGGHCLIVSFHDDSAESRYRQEPATDLSADKLFERRWAMTLLDRALSRLRTEYAAAEKEVLFNELQSFISGAAESERYATLAARLRMTEGALKVVVHRARKRYGTILRDEIAQTVSTPEEVEEEVRYLLEVLGRS